MVRFSTWLAPAIALSGAVTNVWASPVPEDGEVMLEERQSGQYLPVTGVTEGGNALRYEIRTFQSDHPVAWNLYIQALERFQKQTQDDKGSWYSIAGIHGVPIKPWDGVTGSGGSGYCPHDSNLFGPWHRPYLALFEQRLHSFAVTIAEEYPAAQKAQMRAAAQTFRMPYWDWAAVNTPVLPQVVMQPKITVTRPSGKKATINNPLFSYKFHPLSASDMGNFSPFSIWGNTKREPTSTAKDATSQNAAVESGLESNAGSYRSRIYNILIGTGTYNKKTNHGSGSQGDTIESVHDNIHASFGSNSHMLYLSYSAFDPVFILHHTNVDRILAIWQKLHPNTYIEPYAQSGSTYTVAQGSTQNAQSPLTPFHKNQNGDFWTSAAVRDHHVFHYEYTELQGNPSQAAVRTSVNNLYGTGAAGVSSSIASMIKKRSLSDLTAPELDLNISPDDTLQQYVISVGSPLNALNGPYTTYLFLGDFNEDDVSGWSTDDNLCGTHTVLGSMAGANNLVYGQIIMTQPLLKKFAAGDLTDLDEETVLQYIKDNLHWRVSQNNQAVDDDSIPDLDVQLLTNAVQPRLSPADFPTFIKTDVTHGFINSTLGGLLAGQPCPEEV